MQKKDIVFTLVHKAFPKRQLREGKRQPTHETEEPEEEDDGISGWHWRNGSWEPFYMMV
jgi:hypothetical protein